MYPKTYGKPDEKKQQFARFRTHNIFENSFLYCSDFPLSPLLTLGVYHDKHFVTCLNSYLNMGSQVQWQCP